MTLFKQIALIVSFFSFILLATVLSVNFTQTSEAVQQQLYEDAKNTATSLSLSLGTAGGDETIMSTMINANFDSGHYTRIALYDIDEELIYERITEQVYDKVPAWFINTFSINIPSASAQVSSGWSPIGILSVQSNSSYAYDLLYDTFYDLILLFFIVAIFGLSAIAGALHAILRPLTNVRRQAEAILNNEFIIQEKMPYTTEFKHVVKGMNAMVKKVEDIFEKGNKAMRHNHELLYNDNVTKLYNRRYLMMKLPQYVDEESIYDAGGLILIALEGAQEANKAIGHQKVDELFGTLGGLIQSHGDDFDDMLAARVNGTEFALLMPGCEADEALEIAQQICKASEMMLEHYKLSKADGFGVFAGVYDYRREDSISDILSGADYALAQARLLPLDNAYLHTAEALESVMGKESWREVISDGMRHNRFSMNFWPVYNTKAKALQHKVMTFCLNDQNGVTYSYGQFIAPVISLGMEDDVYLHVIKHLMALQDPALSKQSIAVRTPTDLLKSVSFMNNLAALFEQYAHDLPFSMIVEIPDKLIVENLEHVRQLAALFKRFNVRFGINQFTGESKNYDFLKEIKPLYIQADTAFLLDQSQQSISTLQIITDSLGIELMAAGVRTHKELERLSKLHIFTIQGPLAEELV